ncbi:hypothetical protein [Streptomyces griseoloalbus]|uniref:Cell wall assembly regulator SMI1 n=1 Tax=Streptomyces griseoloalbus TaxID=67303 RepID=A0A7W8BSV6_9ACTN|nr:hypothetical protein [Streptomyces albaduncus]MBB5128292.1 cell wall assembly regulator SMI1 [Streptomyces albaduncus]GGW54526.1 hypothetical protein GCM10010340_36490 [Streptomyces albaduncus]
MAVTAQDAIEALRELERRLPDRFTIEPGATDAELTEAEPRLPDDIRTLLRAVSAIRVAGGESLSLDPRVNRVDRRWMWGPGEETRVLLSLATGDHFFVDVHPGTGAWGAVFSQSADFFDTYAYCARSLPEFLVDYAREAMALADRVEAEPDAYDRDEEEFTIRFPCESVWGLRTEAFGTPVAELRGTDDPDLAAVIAGLPDEVSLVDLRTVEPPLLMELRPTAGKEEEFMRCGPQRQFAVAVPANALPPYPAR